MKNSDNGRQKFLVRICLLTRWLAYYVNTAYILNTILCHKNQYQLETFWIKPWAEAISMKSVCWTDEPNVSVSLDSFEVKITQYFRTSFSLFKPSSSQPCNIKYMILQLLFPGYSKQQTRNEAPSRPSLPFPV